MKRATSVFFVVSAGAVSSLVATSAYAQQPAPAAAAPAAPSAAAAEVAPPTVITHVDAQYPLSARAARKHGDVMLALTVDADGHVSKVDVLESGGAENGDRSASRPPNAGAALVYGP